MQITCACFLHFGCGLVHNDGGWRRVLAEVLKTRGLRLSGDMLSTLLQLLTQLHVLSNKVLLTEKS